MPTAQERRHELDGCWFESQRRQTFLLMKSRLKCTSTTILLNNFYIKHVGYVELIILSLLVAAASHIEIKSFCM